MGSLLQMTSLVMEINKNEFQKNRRSNPEKKITASVFQGLKRWGFYYTDKNGYYELFVESKNIILHNYRGHQIMFDPNKHKGG